MNLVRIQDAAPLDGYRVRLKLTDGRVIERDLGEYLTGPVFADIRSGPDRFREFRVEAGTLVWPGGADLCPDVLIWGCLPPAFGPLGRFSHGRLTEMDQPLGTRHAQMFEANEKALNGARDFHDWMLRQHEDQDTIWFVNVLTALLRGLIVEYEQLNLGYKQSARLMAWACRNLMEISIYTEYALNSQENAHELIEDMFMDTLEVFTSFKKWFSALEPGMPTPELDAVLKSFQETKKEVGINRKTYRSTRELAVILDREPDYLHANKVSSKLIHPTAWSLLSLDLDKDDALMRPYLYQAGSKYFAESFLRIRQYVAKHGTKPIAKAEQ